MRMREGKYGNKKDEGRIRERLPKFSKDLAVQRKWDIG